MTDPDYEEIDFSNASDLVKGRQRFFRRPKRTGDIIGQMMARQGYAQTKSNDELNEAWEIAVGPRFTKSTKAGRINRGVLEVQNANDESIIFLTR